MFNQYMDHSSKCNGQYSVLRQEEIVMQQSDTSRFKHKWLDVSGAYSSTTTASINSTAANIHATAAGPGTPTQPNQAPNMMKQQVHHQMQQQQQQFKPAMQQQQQQAPQQQQQTASFYDNRANKMSSPAPSPMPQSNHNGSNAKQANGYQQVNGNGGYGVDHAGNHMYNSSSNGMKSQMMAPNSSMHQSYAQQQQQQHQQSHYSNATVNSNTSNQQQPQQQQQMNHHYVQSNSSNQQQQYSNFNATSNQNGSNGANTQHVNKNSQQYNFDYNNQQQQQQQQQMTHSSMSMHHQSPSQMAGSFGNGQAPSTPQSPHMPPQNVVGVNKAPVTNASSSSSSSTMSNGAGSPFAKKFSPMHEAAAESSPVFKKNLEWPAATAAVPASTTTTTTSTPVSRNSTTPTLTTSPPTSDHLTNFTTTPISNSHNNPAMIPVNLNATNGANGPSSSSASSSSSSKSILSEINIDELLMHYPNVFDELFSNNPFRLTSIEQIENELRSYCEQQFKLNSSAANSTVVNGSSGSSSQQFSIRI